ncbi:Wolframin [Gryllus bimaculatus]|nr:Wolframin [Gryllus bimaculatus]
MAGVVPVPIRTGRKQWTLHDGPRGSLRRLRSQLAEDGCPESQVVYAKQLLEEKCEEDEDKEENARLGVYWLTKASEQGNLEATAILKQCLETGQGITEHNFLEVKTCLNTPQDEKLARRAAREMFSCLSDGQDFITTEQLQKQIEIAERQNIGVRHKVEKQPQRILGSNESTEKAENSCEKESAGNSDGTSTQNDALFSSKDWTSRDEDSGQKVTEDHLVTAASNYARGELPLMHRVLTLSQRGSQAVDSMHFLHRSLLHPLNSLHSLYINVVDFIVKNGSAFLSALFPSALSHVQTLLILVVYSLCGTESLLLFIPMIAYCISFIVMVVSTFQMIHRKREFHDFRKWSCLFISYSGGNLNPEEAEYQYCSKNLRPYVHFFVALLVNLLIYPVIAAYWTPQTELTVIAFFLTLLTLYAFMDNRKFPDFLALFSFAVNILAKYPYETDAVVTQGWRFLDVRIPTFASYVVGNGVEFCLNFRAVFYLLIPAIFVKMASRDKWRGTYKTLIPHCVTLSWWQVAVICSQGATWYALIRSTLAMVGLILIVPLAGLGMIILPVFAVGKYLANSAILLRVLSSVALASVPLGIALYLKRWRLQGYTRATVERFIARTQIIVMVAAAVFLLMPLVTELSIQDDESSDRFPQGSLSWEQYLNYCHQPAWERTSMATVQLQCAQLAGTPVSWDGYISQVKIRSISNTLQTIVGKLPKLARNILTCYYGEPYNDNCDENLTESQFRQCKMIKELKTKHSRCHLEGWNKYEFEVHVKMKSGMWGTAAEISLIADNSFRNFTLALRPGDRVWFTGTLLNEGKGDNLLGGQTPQIDLLEIGCLGCHVSEIAIHKKIPVSFDAMSLLSYVYVGIKSVLNFVFNPLVIFK